VLIFIVIPRNTSLFQVYSLKVGPKEHSHYNLCEEAVLLLPGVTASLQNGNIRIWSTSQKHTRVQPVLYLRDLPNSAK
jgi:hypothetical protein